MFLGLSERGRRKVRQAVVSSWGGKDIPTDRFDLVCAYEYSKEGFDCLPYGYVDALGCLEAEEVKEICKELLSERAK